MALPRVLETERLRLEATSRAHSDGLWKATEVSLHDLKPWMPWTVDASPATAEAFAASCEHRWNAGIGWNFTIIEDDAVVGSAGLHNYDAMFSEAEVGYWLRSDRAGQGLMTEVVEALIRFAFDHLKIHRLVLRAGEENMASQRIAEKLGFVREGLEREGGKGAEGRYNAYVYALLVTDPRPTVGRGHSTRS